MSSFKALIIILAGNNLNRKRRLLNRPEKKGKSASKPPKTISRPLMRALRTCFYLSLQCIMCWRKVWTFWKFLSIDRAFLFQHCAFIGRRTCWTLATFYNSTSLVDALVTRRQYSGALLKIIIIFILLRGASPLPSFLCHHHH